MADTEPDGLRMGLRLLVISGALFLLTEVQSLPHSCSSNDITTGAARCCQPCPVGSGVIKPCNNTHNTLCEICIPNRTFSAVASHHRPCRHCTQCPDHARLVRACNSTHDALCECNLGYYMTSVRLRPLSSGTRILQCVPCDLCPTGHGAVRRCTPGHNTRCRRCSSGTHSVERTLEPCAPCTRCGAEQLMLQKCRPAEDTICMDITPVKPTIIPMFLKTVSTLVRTETEPARRSNSIPVYCAFLAGVIAGLIAYVIVVQIRRSKARHSKGSSASPLNHPRGPDMARLAIPGCNPQGPLPKQGSDSGVFVDAADHVNSGISPSFPVRDLPQSLRRAIEKAIHAVPDTCGGWRTLARQLGYNSARSSAFHTRSTRDHALPCHHLLADWSKRSHATVGALQVALYKIGRDDVCGLFQSDAARHVSRSPAYHLRSRESVPSLHSAPLYNAPSLRDAPSVRRAPSVRNASSVHGASSSRIPPLGQNTPSLRNAPSAPDVSSVRRAASGNNAPSSSNACNAISVQGTSSVQIAPSFSDNNARNVCSLAVTYGSPSMIDAPPVQNPIQIHHARPMHHSSLVRIAPSGHNCSSDPNGPSTHNARQQQRPRKPEGKHQRQRRPSIPEGNEFRSNESKEGAVGINIPDRQPDGAASQPISISPTHKHQHRHSVPPSVLDGHKMITI